MKTTYGCLVAGRGLFNVRASSRLGAIRKVAKCTGLRFRHEFGALYRAGEVEASVSLEPWDSSRAVVTTL